MWLRSRARVSIQDKYHSELIALHARWDHVAERGAHPADALLRQGFKQSPCPMRRRPGFNAAMDNSRHSAPGTPPLEPPPTTYLGRSSGGGSGGGLGVLYEHRSLNTAVVTVVLRSPAGPRHRRTLTRISFYYLEPSSQSPNPQTAAEPFFHLQGRRSPREPAPPAHHTLPHRTAHRHLVDDLGFFSGGGASRAAAWVAEQVNHTSCSRPAHAPPPPQVIEKAVCRFSAPGGNGGE